MNVLESFLRHAGTAALATCLVAGAAHAVGTRYFSIDSAAVMSDGKLEGTAVLSTGSVVASVPTRRIALPNVPVARSLLVQKDGSAFIGTGNDGKIWKLTGDVPAVFAETGALLVSALAMDASGTLYAGTLPKGELFAVDKQGKARVLIALPGAELINALAYDDKKKVLYAATGPEGKVFAVRVAKDGKPSADVYYDAEASHVMALALGADGTLYAGTSDEALLLSISAPGKAEVVLDMEGNEVTAIAREGSTLAVAANLFPKPGSGGPKKPAENKDNQKSDDKTEAPKDEQKPGKGQLWVVEPGGRARKLFSSEQGHITAVQWAASGGAVYAATGKEGQIHRVEQDGRSALWLDVDERQILAIDLRAAQPMFVTSDAGAVYRVLSAGTGGTDAQWTSKVLDAQSLARFGELTFRGRGGLSLATRSGNTEKPDATWSAWSGELTKSGPVRSPAARFLQIRAKLKGDGAELYAVTAYYLPLNQSANVTEVTAKPKTSEKASKGEADPSSVYTIEWKADNPDGDKLRYRLYFRPESEAKPRAILKEDEILTKTSYDWETEALPDGYYRITVEASDELDSPENAVLKKVGESEPFLVDNHKPHVDGLKLAGGKLQGVARDVPGPVTKLERAIDGGDFVPFFSSDELLDTSEEKFELVLPKLESGRHVIAVRATDARGNRGSAELWVTVP